MQMRTGSNALFYLEMYGLLAGIPAIALGVCAVLWRLSHRQEDAERSQLTRIGIALIAGSILVCLASLGIDSLPPPQMRSVPVLMLPLLLICGAFAACIGLVLTAWNGRGLVRLGAVFMGLFALTLSVLFGLGLFVAPG